MLQKINIVFKLFDRQSNSCLWGHLFFQIMHNELMQREMLEGFYLRKKKKFTNNFFSSRFLDRKIRPRSKRKSKFFERVRAIIKERLPLLDPLWCLEIWIFKSLTARLSFWIGPVNLWNGQTRLLAPEEFALPGHIYH